jgi:release factor glutamine methyltransferase
VSNEALEVAMHNAGKLKAAISFIHHDILRSDIPVHDLDMVVSNPPYITPREQALMKRNVITYEPHLALFTLEEDPLLFYKAIAGKAMKMLKHGGFLFVEINENSGKAISEIFSEKGFQDIHILKDLQGKDRIMSGRKNFS